MISKALQLSCLFHELGAELSVPTSPRGLNNPKWVKINDDAAMLLGLPPTSFQSQWHLDLFSGNLTPEKTQPVAQAYAGHQFGKFNPFLGDGRSILIGEVHHQSSTWDIALKGAGKTPFTFSSDGRVSLSECIHEYTISQKLKTLNIPTVQCLCIIKGDEKIYRSGFEEAAILTRVASSFIRFGTFEACYYKKNFSALTTLADYVIQQHFPDIFTNERDTTTQYSLFFDAIVIRTAKLIALWQKSGFVHGMMNTDNQSIMGITLDVGESYFLSDHDKNNVSTINNTSDRYAFESQPVIGLWNCNVLAKSLSPLIPAENLKQSISKYEPTYFHYLNG